MHLKIKEQVEEYIKIREISKDKNDHDPGVFWKCHEKTCPELAAFAKYVLTSPTTSAPVERVFSICGNILAPNRRRLKYLNFIMLTFLRCNLAIFSD